MTERRRAPLTALSTLTRRPRVELRAPLVVMPPQPPSSRMVDNAVYSFGSQLSNGIPFLPFKFDKEDIEFTDLMNYIEAIHNQPDYRVCNEKAFQMEKVFKFNLQNYVKYYEYDENDASDLEEDVKQDT